MRVHDNNMCVRFTMFLNRNLSLVWLEAQPSFLLHLFSCRGLYYNEMPTVIVGTQECTTGFTAPHPYSCNTCNECTDDQNNKCVVLRTRF